MANQKMLVSVSLIVALPILLHVGWTLFPNVGSIPYLLYQFYYAPLGFWLQRPFFAHDSELGILVLPLGAFLTPAAYLLIFGFANKVWALTRTQRVQSSSGLSEK